MLKKWMTAGLAILMSTAFLTACTDNEHIKTAIQQSLVKQKEVNSHQFTGSLSLSISDALLSSPQPLTNNLLSLLRESTLEWNGAVSVEPVQFEADLQLSPKGTSAGIKLPAFIKDNKLYFNMPAISKPDEYYLIDMAQLSKDSQSPLTPDSLKNTSQLTMAISSLLFNDVDAKWLKEAKELLKLQDGTLAKSFALDITKKNEKELNELFRSKLPELMNTLQTNGFITGKQVEALINGPLKNVQIIAPGQFHIAIDDQNFIRELMLDLNFNVTAANGSINGNHIILKQAYNKLNETPSFSKEVPGKVKSFDEVLKLLKGAAPAAK